MSPEEKRIKIAELCGWQKCECVSECKLWLPPGTAEEDHRSAATFLPRYLTDLNAMHEAIKSLDYYDRRKVAQRLWHTAETEGGDIWDDYLALTLATPEQLADAFLRAHNIKP